MNKTLTLFVLPVLFGSLYAQKIDKENLYRTWYLDKYSDEAQYYPPPKKEIGDYITLNADMTYTAITQGELDSGTWVLNTNGTYLELKSADDHIEKMYIYFLSTRSLVVVYDVDEHRAWEVHYVSGT